MRLFRVMRGSCVGFKRVAALPASRSREGKHMLDERLTLRILGWTVGTMCIGTLVLSALSLP
jgi:hypothetical protein